jgi:hypothetical protein
VVVVVVSGGGGGGRKWWWWSNVVVVGVVGVGGGVAVVVSGGGKGGIWCSQAMMAAYDCGRGGSDGGGTAAGDKQLISNWLLAVRTRGRWTLRPGR